MVTALLRRDPCLRSSLLDQYDRCEGSRQESANVRDGQGRRPLWLPLFPAMLTNKCADIYKIDMQWECRTGFPLVHSFNDLLFEPVDWLQYWEATSASPYACLPSLSLSRRMGDSRSRESGSARHLRSLECTCLPATNLPLHNRSFKWTLATTSEIDSIWRGELNMSCLIMISI